MLKGLAFVVLAYGVCNADLVVTKNALEKYLQFLNQQDSGSDKQCQYDHLGPIFKYLNEHAKLQNVLVHTPCLNAKSLGNGLTNYMEARLCANVTNMHYVALSKYMFKDDTRLFFSPIPEIILNPKAPSSYSLVKSLCTCLSSSCHESQFSLVHKYPNIARDILSPIVMRHIAVMSKSSLAVNESNIWRHNSRNKTSSLPHLPAIPDVSIHYRCGDNDIGVYGLLGFAAIINRIPIHATTIYVISENPYRKTKPKQRAVCATVLKSLHHHLVATFPNASVMVLRGAPLYDDFSRLASSHITICSISTFCFWAAIAAKQSVVFMPISKLLANGLSPDYGPTIVWMNQSYDVVVPGPVVSRRPVRSILQMLTSNLS